MKLATIETPLCLRWKQKCVDKHPQYLPLPIMHMLGYWKLPVCALVAAPECNAATVRHTEEEIAAQEQAAAALVGEEEAMEADTQQGAAEEVGAIPSRCVG